MQFDINDTLYSVAEVSKYFRIQPTTLYKWISLGRLTAIKLPNGHMRVRASELARVMNDSN